MADPKFKQGDRVEVLDRGFGVVEYVVSQDGVHLYTVELTENRRPRSIDETQTLVYVLEGGLSGANPNP